MIFRCTDRDGIEIMCTKDTWQNHIVAEHPEMIGCESYVKQTIENPDCVYEDFKYKSTKNFYTSPTLPTQVSYPYLRVSVKYHKNVLGKTRGYVKSAFPCVSKRKGDRLIWEKQ